MHCEISDRRAVFLYSYSDSIMSVTSRNLLGVKVRYGEGSLRKAQFVELIGTVKSTA
jgi:hypothetical protein